jgi:hypothetical protein
MPRQGIVLFSHVPVPASAEDITPMPMLCRHCAMPLVDKPFMIVIYFAEHEVQCSHIACETNQVKK